jgi:hypothetical protein
MMTFALWALHLGSVVWVGVDASKRDFSGSRFANKTWQWVVGALLVWIIVFPVYLFKRGNAPLKALQHGTRPLAPLSHGGGWPVEPVRQGEEPAREKSLERLWDR